MSSVSDAILGKGSSASSISDTAGSIFDSDTFGLGSETTGTGDSSSFFGGLNSTTIIIIIVLLIFLGFNIFVYLAQGTEYAKGIFAPLFEKIFGTTVGVTSQVVDVSAEGAKQVVGATADVVQGGLTAVQEITPNPANNSSSQSVEREKSAQTQDAIQQSSLNNAIDNASKQQNAYEPDYASSSIQGGGKSGWCYIGEDRNFRSCVEVGKNDTCLSGQIFPTQEICMNPSLRE